MRNTEKKQEKAIVQQNNKQIKSIMNENINLVEILKDCPKGTKLYTPLVGEVKLKAVRLNRGNATDPIEVTYNNKGGYLSFTKEGLYYDFQNGECLLFPAKDQRDWSKWECPKPNFDPKTLKPFDKVLARNYLHGKWTCGFFSHIVVFDDACKYNVGEILYTMCIPYNDDTKHLVGTTEEVPEYYRYWED